MNLKREVTMNFLKTAHLSGQMLSIHMELFFVDGDITTISEKSGVPSYEVAEGNLTLYYNYGNALLNADEDAWHLVNDKKQKSSWCEIRC